MDIKKTALTESQLGIYLECKNETEGIKYLLPITFTFERNKINAQRLASSFDAVVNNFSTFSIVIKEENAEPYMTAYGKNLPEIEIIKAKDCEIEKIKSDLFIPFKFDGSLLWRAKVIETETRIILHLVIHHTVFDGTSIGVLNKALAAAYNGIILKESNTLFDEKAKEAEIQKSEKFRIAEKYFDRYMSGADSDSNINPDVYDDKNAYKPESEEFFPKIEIGRVYDFAKKNGVTENIVFLSAFAYTLAKFNNQKNAVFSSAESGRFGGGYENSMGMFVKSFPLNIEIDENENSSKFVKTVKKNFFMTLTNNNLNFSDFIKDYPGCADVRFLYQGELLKSIPVNDEYPEVNVCEDYKAVSNMDFLVFKEKDRYKIQFGYNNSKYSAELINCFADLYFTVLDNILSNKKLNEFNLFTDNSKVFFNKINNTATDIDLNETVIDIFEKTVKKYGNKTAVSYKDKSYTYSEIDALTKKLASYINKKGIGKDGVVSVLIPRNEYTVITAFGIVRAGGAYQPLDITYPEERLNFMVSDCKAELVIADREYIHLLKDYKGEVLYIDEIENLPECEEFISDAKPNDAFVLIYTSGTTGTPKGCVLENHNIVTFYYRHRKNTELNSESRVATVASFGFDAGVMDIFTTVLAGATLYIVPEEIKLDLGVVEKFYCENKITNGFMTTQLGRMFLEQTKCETLKVFMLGGEKLVPFTPPENVKCINAYGPSETMAYVCSYRIKDNGIIQPIGKINDNTKFYIIDKLNRLLPVGACGELCVAGLQVGRGYFERPEKTSEVFIDNPFCKDNGYTKLYKTGDIVRMLPDGNVDYIGRRDGQVKIRGFRIELTEVEQVIREFANIKNATVQAYDDAVSGKYLCAFIVADTEIDISVLNAFILDRKPSYMVPAVTMQVENIPVNANGKVDKKKLPKPERKIGDVIKPKTEIQQKLFKLIASVIGTEDFGIDNDFYTLGLSSIGSIRLCSLVAENFDINLQIKDLKQNGNITKLEEFILSNEKIQNEKLEKFEDYPLTKTQEGIFIECVSNSGSTFYNIPLLLKLSDKIDINRLKTAIADTVNAHSYIKTEMFTDENGKIRQKRNDSSAFGIEDIETVRINSISEFLSVAVMPFKLENSRLFRIKIINAECNYLFIEIHHIISDGSSLKIIISDIEKAYNGETLNGEAFTEFELALSETERRKTSEINDAYKYYEKLLSGLDMNFLPDRDRLPFYNKDSGVYTAYQTLSDMEKINKFCNENNISVNGFLCSAFGFVLAKYAGMSYSVFNTVYNGRSDSRVSNTVGMLVKTLPVVCDIEKDYPDLIAKNISNQLIDSMANDLFSYAEITNKFGVKNDIIFVYQGDSFGFDSFCGEKSEEIGVNLSGSKAPISVEASVCNGRLKFNCEYNTDMFTEKFIKTFISSYDKAIKSFVENKKTDEISLVTDDILNEINGYNNTESVYDTSKTTADLFIEQVNVRPEKTCIAYKDIRLTFGDVYTKALKISNYLNKKNIGHGDVVSILINRNHYMTVSVYGAVLAGSAYVGLDPTYPEERLEFMINDSGSKIVIAERELVGLICGYKGEILYTDEIDDLPLPDDNFKENYKTVTPDEPMLIIYSSGTTGTPKGSVLCHKNIVCFYHNFRKDMNISEKSNVANYASFGFDGGAMDIFDSSMAGATLYVIPDEIRLDLSKIEEFYIENKITTGFMTTQVGAMFIANTKCETLTHFMVGGEKYIPVTPPNWVTLYNGYGPSETFCYVNRYKITDTGKFQPIGKTNDNVKEYIIDKYGNMLPFGALGELCISGGQTGKGYLNRPEKTAENFVDNPFCNVNPYDRMYKTGDIVRQLPDGNYDFVGRRDGQVKIRGFRVELTEIEQKIREFNGIENVTVQAFDSMAGGKYLCAYIVSEKQIDISALNLFIAKEKPDYMIPAVTLQIDKIPLTSNGKVDKKKLPAPTESVKKAGLEPANETEEAFCEIFGDVLGIEKVYADDDFFHIGGSSISAIQVVVKCNKLGYDIVFKNLYANPTPKLLADFIHNGQREIVFASDENKTEKFDYSALKNNIIENASRISYKSIGDVLLTGATGFLGSHLVKELLDNTDSHIICLVRGKGKLSAERRFKMMMIYYFEDWFDEEKERRITVVEGGLDNKETLEKCKKYRFDTIINSAANVKHFADGDKLLKDNFETVKNLIDFADRTNAKLIQISSLSVSGEASMSAVPENYKFRENELNIGQKLENKYIYSKYQAEQAVIDAVSKGLIKGKVIRLGNLMARDEDSEFQINAHSSSFLRQFAGYFNLGMFPVDIMDKDIEFSPIDSVARAVVLLSGTPDEFTAFHANNCNKIKYGYVIEAMIKEGLNIKVVEPEIFEERYKKALDEEKDLSDFTTLIAYLNNKNESGGKTAHQIDSDNTFTVKALYRLGFSWPLTSMEYLRKMIRTLIDLSFFAEKGDF